jgi:predicted methyltransferase
MRIISVSNTSFTHRPEERSIQRTPMQIMALAFATYALAFGVIAFAAAGPLPDVSAALAAAVADSSRPDSDTIRDADRRPAQTLMFVGIKSGDKVADYVADAGYFTRLFANVVGSKGHVYAVEPTAFFKFQHFVNAVAELQGYAVDHSNVTVTTAAALEGVRFPEKLDLFWISRNYHDLHDKFMGPVDTAAFNKAVYEALKPGGFYVVLDHSAAPGAAADVTETLHRIEPSTVRGRSRGVQVRLREFDSRQSGGPTHGQSVRPDDSRTHGSVHPEVPQT